MLGFTDRSLASIRSAVTWINRVITNADETERLALLEASEVMAEALREEAPGSLGSQMRVEVSRNKADYLFPEHAVFVLKGTKPHMIFPVNVSALHFFMKDGSEVFAASVYHPGQKANPFIDRAVEHAGPEINRRFGQRVASWVVPENE